MQAVRDCAMIEIRRDGKANRPIWIITHRDAEGFHRQLALPEEDMQELVRQWTMIKYL